MVEHSVVYDEMLLGENFHLEIMMYESATRLFCFVLL